MYNKLVLVWFNYFLVIVNCTKGPSWQPITQDQFQGPYYASRNKYNYYYSATYKPGCRTVYDHENRNYYECVRDNAPQSVCGPGAKYTESIDGHLCLCKPGAKLFSNVECNTDENCARVNCGGLAGFCDQSHNGYMSCSCKGAQKNFEAFLCAEMARQDYGNNRTPGQEILVKQSDLFYVYVHLYKINDELIHTTESMIKLDQYFMMTIVLTDISMAKSLSRLICYNANKTTDIYINTVIDSQNQKIELNVTDLGYKTDHWRCEIHGKEFGTDQYTPIVFLFRVKYSLTNATPILHDVQDTNTTPKISKPTTSITVASIPTPSIPVASIPTVSTTAASIPKASTTAASIPTASTTAASIPTASTTIASIPTASTTAASIPTASTTAESIAIASTTAASIPTASTPAASIPTASTDNTKQDGLTLVTILALMLATLILLALVIWLIIRLHQRKRRMILAQASSDINYENLPGHGEGPMATPPQWDTHTPTHTHGENQENLYCIPYPDERTAKPLSKALQQRPPVETPYADIFNDHLINIDPESSGQQSPLPTYSIVTRGTGGVKQSIQKLEKKQMYINVPRSQQTNTEDRYPGSEYQTCTNIHDTVNATPEYIEPAYSEILVNSLHCRPHC